MLNISPLFDGSIPEAQQKVCLEAGKWLTRNGEAIYGVNAPSVEGLITSPCGRFSVKGNNIYCYLHIWPDDGSVVIGGIKETIKEVYVLSTRQTLKFRQSGNQLVVQNLPEEMPDKYCAVLLIKKA